jgi:hypothetical protein
MKYLIMLLFLVGCSGDDRAREKVIKNSKIYCKKSGIKRITFLTLPLRGITTCKDDSYAFIYPDDYLE